MQIGEKEIKKWIETILEPNKGVVKEFDRYNAARGVKHSTRGSYILALKSLMSNTSNKKLKDVTRKDLEKWFASFNGVASESTVNLYKTIIKKFYQWLYDMIDEYPDVVRWIRYTHGQTTLPDALLTKEDIRKMVQFTDNQRDRALVMVLYESGLRSSELLSLKIRNITFDQYGAVIILPRKAKGLKTGQRRIRLIDSVPDLQLWINMHPLKDDGDAALWLPYKALGIASEKGESLAYEGFYFMIKRLGERAGLKIPVTPHLFRHSIATERAKEYTEQELKVMFGWSGSSKMAGRYVHLSGEDVDRKMLEKKGLLTSEDKAKDKEKEKVLEPRKCPRCESINPADFKFCGKCSMALDLKAAMEVEDMREKVDSTLNKAVEMDEKEFTTLILGYLAKKGLLGELEASIAKIKAMS